MYYFTLKPKPEMRRRFSRELTPSDVYEHAHEVNVRDKRFKVEMVGGELRICCQFRELTNLLHQRLSRFYHVEPVTQFGFERRRQRVGA